MQTIFFIGQEKPLSNLVNYDALKLFLKKDFLVVTTTEIASKYKFTNKVISFESKWTRRDWVKYLDYLMLKNLFSNSRSTINLMLRTRLLGPYKFNSIYSLKIGGKYLFNFIKGINWLIFLNNFRNTPEKLLNSLREKNAISEGDRNEIRNKISKIKIKRAVIFTTFNDPVLLDFIAVCNELNIQTLVLPDCWDNISTAVTIPRDISHLYLWSPQQLEEVRVSFTHLYSKSQVIGSYRFQNYQKNSFPVKNKDKPIEMCDLRILYLESNLFEDRNFVLERIVQSIMNSRNFGEPIKRAKIIVREYPGVHQSAAEFRNEFLHGENSKTTKLGIDIMRSDNTSLKEDLIKVDIVFSELTTAALEAAHQGIPIVFVGSSKSPRYITTNKSYNYSFARDLRKFFEVINLDYDESIIRISELLTRLVKSQSTSLHSVLANGVKHLDISFFLEQLNYETWAKIIDLDMDRI